MEKTKNNIKQIINKYKWFILVMIITLILGLIFKENLVYFQGNIMTNILTSDPFDGTIFPVEKIPDYTKVTKEERISKTFDQFDSNLLIDIPNYYTSLVEKDIYSLNANKNEDKEIIRAKMTFTVPYLGSYSKMWAENTGSHPGVDIILPIGTPILAVANAIVVVAKDDTKTGAGKHVVLRHDNVPYIDENGNEITTTLFSAYEHLSEINVKVGDKIKKGTVIGKSGNTGRSTTPHLHFQIDKKTAKYHPVYYNNATETAKDTIHPIAWVYKYSGNTYNTNVIASNANNNVNKITNNENTNIKTIKEEKQENNTGNEIINNIETNTNTIITTNTGNNLEINNKTSTSESITANTNIETEKKEENKNIFIDVLENHPNYQAIKYLKEKGVLNGYSDGTFKPDNEVTRAEFLKIIFNGLSLKIDNYSYTEENMFKDVEKGSWYEKYVYNAKDKNLVKGYEGNLFKPTQGITKAESIKIIYSAKNIDPLSANLPNTVIDVSDNDWFKQYIAHALENGYIDAINGESKPNKPMTRAEIAELIYRIIKQ